LSYVAKEVIGLPVHEDREVHPGITVPVPIGETIRKEPGDKITRAELKAHGQSDEDIEKLIKAGALEEES
jgi:hypothetical protein